MKRYRPAPVESLENRLLFAVISVLNTDDSGAGSLRDAIAAATTGDTLDLTDLSGTITLASKLTIDKDLTIAGPGSAQLAVSGNDTGRVLEVNGGVTAHVHGLTITHGFSSDMAAGIFNSGELTLDHVVVSENVVTGNYVKGGAIFDQGTLTLIDSSVVDNQLNGQDGALGGGIYTVGTNLSLTRTTVAGNSATATAPAFWQSAQAFGGGLAIYGSGTGQFVNCTIANNTLSATSGDISSAIGGEIFLQNPNGISLINCTVVGNSVSDSWNQEWGGGMYSFTGSAALTNTIFAGNHASHFPDLPDWSATDGGHNLIGAFDDPAPFVNGDNGNLVGTSANPLDPMVGTLSDNGGATMTMGLLDGSPAIDAGTSSGAPVADQRGHARTGATDIGAFEAGPVNAAPSFTSTAVTSATSETAFVYDITAHDTDGDTLTITATSTLPDWLTLDDEGDGTASLFGTPVNDDAGDVSVTLRVSDGITQALQSFTLHVSAINHAPALAPTADGGAVAGVAFEQTVNATDADGDDTTFNVGSKPTWLTVTDNEDGTATLSGTPAIGDYGANGVVLQADDGDDESLQHTYTVNVSTLRWQLSGGVLAVTGTAGDDVLQIQQKGSQVRLTHNGVLKLFPAADVTSVEVYSFDGNDLITFNTRGIPAYAIGGTGNDTLLGGDEADLLSGGGGRDSIVGGGGDDRLNGYGGNDRLEGGAGNDRLFGGDGNDVLVGGAGTDQLRGEDGDDVIYARDGAVDSLVAGPGNNFAQLDDADTRDELITLLA